MHAAMHAGSVSHLGRRRLPPVLLASALSLLAASASSQTCNFRNPSPGDILFSPALDPSIASTRTATSAMRVQCSANVIPTWTFSGRNGPAGSLRLKHVTLDAFIPYTVSATPAGGPSNNQQWTVSATILGPNYVNAPVGAYTDVLTATISP
jgi:hypothetical protein